MPTRVLLAEMTREDVRELAPVATVVLPTAATEQHGPHLPLSTDTDLCTVVCRRAAELAQAQIPVTVAPTLPFGFSEDHFPQPGVLSIGAQTLTHVLQDLGESLLRSGFRRIAIINGHGPNDEIVRVVARDLANRHPVTIAAGSYWTIAWQALYGKAEAGKIGRIPGHAGTFETALMLALRPDLVEHSRLPGAGEEEGVPPEQPHRVLIKRAGQRRGIGPGYTDEPSLATREMGQLYLDTIAQAVATFLVSFHHEHPEG